MAPAPLAGGTATLRDLPLARRLVRAGPGPVGARRHPLRHSGTARAAPGKPAQSCQMNDMATLMTPAPEASICVVVPALNESAVLGRLLAELTPARFTTSWSSTTAARTRPRRSSRHHGVRLIRDTGTRPRAQYRRARHVGGHLLFLADTALQRGADDDRRGHGPPAVVGGCFLSQFGQAQRLLRLYAWSARATTRHSRRSGIRPTQSAAGRSSASAVSRVADSGRRRDAPPPQARRPLREAALPVVTSARRFRKPDRPAAASKHHHHVLASPRCRPSSWRAGTAPPRMRRAPRAQSAEKPVAFTTLAQRSNCASMLS